MLSFRNVTLRRGPRVLFSQASFNLYSGDRIGVVGPNGAGKSSLFALVTGELAPDEGEVSVQSGYVLASVAQDIEPDPRAAVEFVLDGDRELRAVEAELAHAEAAHDAIGRRLPRGQGARRVEATARRVMGAREQGPGGRPA